MGRKGFLNNTSKTTVTLDRASLDILKKYRNKSAFMRLAIKTLDKNKYLVQKEFLDELFMPSEEATPEDEETVNSYKHRGVYNE